MPVLRLLLLLILGLTPRPGTAQSLTPDQITDEHVLKAVDAIVGSLYLRMQPPHYWDPPQWTAAHGSKYQNGGYTALVTLALLEAGESYQDPNLAQAIEYLANLEMEGTYAVATRAHVWAKLPDRFRPHLEKDARWLMDGYSQRGAGWDYDFNPKTLRVDNSLRQYGALGLWEAAKRDVRINPDYWRSLEAAFIANQQPGGGWNYKGDDDQARGSMTAAGLTILFITQDYLHARRAVKLDAPIERAPADAIRRGLMWMNEHFTAETNPGRGTDFFYYLYGVERVGLASGYKSFGGRDWLREGAAAILNQLLTWDDANRTMTVNTERRRPDGTYSTRITNRQLAFALMFLSRGRAPVAINKLAWADEEGRWNNRPRDAANIARQLTTEAERELAWQIVTLDAPAETWLDSAVLYIVSDRSFPGITDQRPQLKQFITSAEEFLDDRAASNVAPDEMPPLRPTITEIEKLKRYIDLGGVVFAVNEGRSRQFAESIELAGRVMYPQYEWRRLPPDHWVYNQHYTIDKRPPRLKALSNGVRELIILAERGDLAASFQKGDFDDAASVFGNIYFHSSELNRPRSRLEPASVVSTEMPVSVARQFTIARGLYSGNWKPEPLALERIRHHAAETLGLGLRIVDQPLALLGIAPDQPDLLWISGTTPHDFTEEEIAQVRHYLESGGTVLFETVGGTGGFARAAEETWATILNTPARSMLRSPIITGKDLGPGARDMQRVDYRVFSYERFGGRESVPRLRGINVDGAPRLLFSDEDLSFSLLDRPRWGISGYSPRAARGVTGNLLLTVAEERSNSP